MIQMPLGGVFVSSNLRRGVYFCKCIVMEMGVHKYFCQGSSCPGSKQLSQLQKWLGVEWHGETVSCPLETYLASVV